MMKMLKSRKDFDLLYEMHDDEIWNEFVHDLIVLLEQETDLEKRRNKLCVLDEVVHDFNLNHGVSALDMYKRGEC